jgi:ureidoglycolate hydrolase
MQGDGPANGDKEHLNLVACNQVEQGTDPIGKALGTRLIHGRALLVAMLDSCVRTLCPRSQTVQREAYRPFGEVLKGASSGFWGMKRLTVSEGTPEEYFRIFARCGISPSHWVIFCKAFMWSYKTHSPYAEATDLEDLERPPMESANATFVSSRVAKSAIEGIQALHESFRTPVYEVCVPAFGAAFPKEVMHKPLASLEKPSTASSSRTILNFWTISSRLIWTFSLGI